MPSKTDITPLLEVSSLEEWDSWLREHHKTDTLVWLVCPKVSKRKTPGGIRYDDSVMEALRYGWVDNLVKGIDDSKYAIRFTPRKNSARWSATNVKRIRILLAENRMTEAGLAVVPNDIIEGRSDGEEKIVPDMVPEYIELALCQHPEAKSTFDSLPPSHKRRYVGWIEDGKRKETRLKRLAEAIETLERGERLGMK